MTLYVVPGVGYVDDTQQDVPHYGYLDLPDGSRLDWGTPGIEAVPTVWNRWQYSPSEGAGRDKTFQWAPGMGGLTPAGYDVAPGYLGTLLDYAAKAELGSLTDLERGQWEDLRTQAQAIPMRDIGSLYLDWQGRSDDPTGLRALNPGSPDVGAVMLDIRQRLVQGTASPQEATLYRQLEAQARDWDWRASTPQPSDAFNPLGDQFFQALNALTMAVGGAGSFGAFGAAGAAGAGAGAGGSVLGIPTSTLATLGTVGGYGAQGAGMLGTALQQPWLTRLAGALGAASGLAGGVAGLGNLAASGVQNVSDVGRLLQSTGRVTGALGAIPGADPLRQAGRYLGLAGQVGRAGGGAGELFQAAQDVQAGATQGGAMSEWDYSNDWGRETPYDNWSWDASGGGTGINWNDPTQWPTETPENWYRDVGQYIGGSDPNAAGTDGGWLSSVLGSLGQVGSFLGSNASWLGPAVSGLTGLGAGALGSQAARDAAGAQTNALNRALELQTAQWLQSQANQAPWLQAGREALPQLQQLAAQGPPGTLPWLAPMTAGNYAAALPGVTPGWTPQAYGGYQPGMTPRAADYRYTPGAVPTLSGQALLANDPGVQFRLDEGRRALEASAAARGGLVSGPTLAALQRQGQELSSQEYANAFSRASQQAQLREQWAQQAAQLGWGQTLQEAQQRAGEQYRGWQSGLTAAQWNQQQQEAWANQLYQRQLAQAGLRRDWDVAENQTAWDRLLQQYNAQQGAATTQWNRLAGLAGIGQTATQQLGAGGQTYATAMGQLYGSLGTAQASGAAGGAQNWLQALGNLNTGLQGTLHTQALLSALNA